MFAIKTQVMVFHKNIVEMFQFIVYIFGHFQRFGFYSEFYQPMDPTFWPSSVVDPPQFYSGFLWLNRLEFSHTEKKLLELKADRQQVV